MSYKPIASGDLAKYLTIAQAATQLGLSTQTLYRLVRGKKLKATQVGHRWFILPADITSLLKPAGGDGGR
jgi:excisionase family DNA binding protein